MNGKNIVIEYGMASIASSKSDHIQIGASLIEIAGITEGNYRCFSTEQKDWTITLDFLVKLRTDFQEAINVGWGVIIHVLDGNTEILSGQAIVTQFDIESNRGNIVRGSFAFAGNGPLEVPVTHITLMPDSIMMNDDSSVTIVPTLIPSYATATQLAWRSTNEAVALVNQNGVVTGVAAGTCGIICSAGNTNAMCQCVITSIPVEQIIVTPSSMRIPIGETRQLVETVLPVNASDESVTWSSTDDSVAEVDELGVVTANSIGTCGILCTANDGSLIYGDCGVAVYDPDNDPVTRIIISPSSINTRWGEYFYITAEVLPETATNRNVTWSSSNEDVALVEQDGYFIARGPGQCTVTATAQDGSGVSDTISVTVT